MILKPLSFWLSKKYQSEHKDEAFLSTSMPLFKDQGGEMKPTTVNARRDGRVLTLYLDNPPRNLMTVGMVKELDALTSSIERDRTIRAVVITSGSPDAFITHFDVEALVANAQAAPGELAAWGKMLRYLDTP